MVIVRLRGGLGNQLFQYAAGRRIALLGGAPLKLDLTAFELSTRSYRLNHYNIVEEVASPAEIRRLSGVGHEGAVARVCRHLNNRLHINKRSVLRERHYRFDPRFLRRLDNVYLDGYWQSEKYFKDIENTVREEFTLKQPPDGMNSAFLATVGHCESVSVHVRRGDYVANPATNRVHGSCDPDYYRRAADCIAESVDKPHFFVFSDDPRWARSSLSFDGPVDYVDHNGEDTDYEDLRLMSRCKHHILANSTFSWWGAWLCHNPDKVVVAPRKWFNDPSLDTSDLIPPSWRRV